MNNILNRKVIFFNLFLVLLTFNVGAQHHRKYVPGLSNRKRKIEEGVLFGGTKQYRTWHIMACGGATSPVLAIGGTNDFTNAHLQFGVNIALRKQLSHAFSLEGSILRGKVSGANTTADNGIKNDVRDFETQIAYASDVRGVLNVCALDFLNKENSLNLYIYAGYGIMAYAPKTTNGERKSVGWMQKAAEGKKYIREAYIPIGGRVKFKLDDNIAFNIGYTMHFIESDNFDGVYANGVSNKDRFSYGYAGLELTLGASHRPNANWVNPLKLLYDSVKDTTLKNKLIDSDASI